MRGNASDASQLPRSLRERLALLEAGLLSFPIDDDGPRAIASRTRARTCFGLGIAGSGVLGGMAFLAMVFAYPDNVFSTRAATDTAAAANPARFDTTSWSPSNSWWGARADSERLDIAIRGSERSSAPLPLYVTGTENINGIRVLVRDMPASAWLSSGERQDANTWALRLADLDDLRLALPDDAPKTFDLTIEVAGATGTRLTKSKARVRIVDEPATPPGPPQRGAAVITETAVSIPDAGRALAGSMVSPPSRVAMRSEYTPRTTFLPRPTGAPTKLAPDVNPPPQARQRRLDGSSGLGGPTRDDVSEQSGRKLWWKMPAPTWTPFEDRAGRSPSIR